MYFETRHSEYNSNGNRERGIHATALHKSIQKKHMLLRLTDFENKLMVTKGEGG